MNLRFLLLVSFALLLCDHRSFARGQERIPQTQYRGGIVTPPLPKPRFVLTDTSGAPFDFWNRTRGSATLLFFGYTYCLINAPRIWRILVRL